MAVLRTVKILLVPTLVVVILDIGLMLIDMAVMVSKLDLHTLCA